MATLERLEYLEDIRNGRWDKYIGNQGLCEFLRTYYNKHYTEIPRESVDAVDWLGYGWPRLDSYGDLIGIGGTDNNDWNCPEGCIDVIVEDANGGEWIVACEDVSDIPDGLRPTESIAELFGCDND